MKKKVLLKTTEKLIKDDEVNLIEVNQCGNELYSLLFQRNFNKVLTFVIFLLLSFLLFNKANKLSFVDLNFYIQFLVLCIVLCFICAVIFFTLYIYNKKKNVLIDKKKLKNVYGFYQIHDLISFVFSVIAVMLFLVMFIATPIEVVGKSMEDNYLENDKLLVWHLNYKANRHDVVIIDVDDKYSFNEETEFVIKRVIALAGDEIKYDIHNKHLLVNGEIACRNLSVEEFETMLTFEQTGKSFRNGVEAVIPDGYVIVLGDNRPESMDSRRVGLILEEDILGGCFYRIYPFNRFGFIK